jgi:hypothetical protein
MPCHLHFTNVSKASASFGKCDQEVAKLEQHPFTAAPKEWINAGRLGSANSESISLVGYVHCFVVRTGKMLRSAESAYFSSHVVYRLRCSSPEQISLSETRRRIKIICRISHGSPRRLLGTVVVSWENVAIGSDDAAI